MRSQTERIHTLRPNPDASRALVVWNTSAATVSGMVVFHADYTLRAGVPLPKIDVVDAVGNTVPSHVCDYRELSSGEPGRTRVVFNLRFEVIALSPRSWHTYFASYNVNSRTIPEPAGGRAHLDPATIVVLETLCRAGDLPLSGRF